MSAGSYLRLLQADTRGASVTAPSDFTVLLEELCLSDQQYDDAAIRALLTALRASLLEMPPSVVSAATHVSRYPGLPLHQLGPRKVDTMAFHAPARVDVAGAFLLRTICRVRSLVDVRRRNTRLINNAVGFSSLFCSDPAAAPLLRYVFTYVYLHLHVAMLSSVCIE